MPVPSPQFGQALQDTSGAQNAPQNDAAVDSVVQQPSDPAVTQLLQNLGDAQEMIASGQYSLLIERAVDLAAGFLPLLVSALFVGFLFWVGYRILDPTIDRFLRNTEGIQSGVRQLLKKTFRVVYIVLAGVMTLDQLGIQVTALLAGLSIAGIAIGFAARDTFENFIAGLTILLDQPFRVGDNIVIGETFGRVDEITLRSTRIQTLDDETVVVPNLQMINQQLINHTLTRDLRVTVDFGIAYKEDTREAREVVLGLTEDDDRLLSDRSPSVVTTALNDSSVDMRLRIWISDPRRVREVRWSYTEEIFLALKEAGIEIPFPHRQLFLDEAKAFEDAPFMRGAKNGSSGAGGGTEPKSPDAKGGLDSEDAEPGGGASENPPDSSKSARS